MHKIPTCFIVKPSKNAIPIDFICQHDFANWQNKQTNVIKNILLINKFNAKPKAFCLVVNDSGKLEKIIFGVEDERDFSSFSVLPSQLPRGDYYVSNVKHSAEHLERLAIAWGIGSYQFTRYKKCHPYEARLVLPEVINKKFVSSAVQSNYLVRDLINTPAADLSPEQLTNVAKGIARKFNAVAHVISGKQLKHGYPLIQAVGAGSSRKSLVFEMLWKRAKNGPKIALVGKGVCFDSGGLNLKPSAGMLLMKKDMAGAAHALGLTQMIMAANLPLQLRLFIPAVENMVSGNSVKPGDVIVSHKGLSVEVTNTDAEGRLILADALTHAAEWQPDLLIDFATLTGAARVALGPDIAALFSNNYDITQGIIEHTKSENEAVWSLPLHKAYTDYLQSNIADIKNFSGVEFAGAISAALFLQRFVPDKLKWVHFDMTAYNFTSAPGRPVGAAAQCLIGLFKYISQYIEK